MYLLEQESEGHPHEPRVELKGSAIQLQDTMQLDDVHAGRTVLG